MKKVMRTIALFIVVTSLMAMSLGCANNKTVRQQSNNPNNGVNSPNGIVDRNDMNSMNRSNGMNTNQTDGMNGINTNRQTDGMGTMNDKVEIADQAAQRIVQEVGVRQANVLITNNNAYVAAVVEDENELSAAIETRIADQVKTVHPNIQNVYVSTNPDFVSSMNRWVDDIQAGHPIQGMAEELDSLIMSIMPNKK